MSDDELEMDARHEERVALERELSEAKAKLEAHAVIERAYKNTLASANMLADEIVKLRAKLQAATARAEEAEKRLQETEKQWKSFWESKAYTINEQLDRLRVGLLFADASSAVEEAIRGIRNAVENNAAGA